MLCLNNIWYQCTFSEYDVQFMERSMDQDPGSSTEIDFYICIMTDFCLWRLNHHIPTN